MTDHLRYATIEDITFAGSANEGTLKLGDGIAYGLGFFDTMMVTHEPILLDWHLERLNESLETFDLPIRINKDLINQVISKYKVQNQVLKIQVDQDNVILYTRHNSYGKDYYDKGLNLSISPVLRSSKSPLVRHKSVNYGDLILSLREAKTKGYDDCIFFNDQGYVCETSVANIFIIKNDRLFTPAIKSGLLPGILRRFILENYPVTQTRMSIDDLAFADGVFITNSVAGPVKVAQIDFDKHIIGTSRLIQMEDFIADQGIYEEHPMFSKISSDYRKRFFGDQ